MTVSLVKVEKIIKPDSVTGTQRRKRLGVDMTLAVTPARTAPIVEPMSNVVRNTASASGLSSDDTLSFSNAVEGAISIPQPNPYNDITITSKAKFWMCESSAKTEIMIL